MAIQVIIKSTSWDKGLCSIRAKGSRRYNNTLVCKAWLIRAGVSKKVVDGDIYSVTFKKVKSGGIGR